MSHPPCTTTLEARRFAPVFILLILAAGGSTLGQTETEYVRSYFQEPLPITLQIGEVAIFDRDSSGEERAASLEPFGINSPDVHDLVVRDWSRANTPPLVQRALDVEEFVRLTADRSGLDFVSPVFISELGLPMIVSPEILVRFKPGIPAADAQAILNAHLQGEITHHDWAHMSGAYRIRLASRNGFEVLEAANALALHPEVKWAEPNMLATGQTTLIPNDPSFGQLWGIRNTGQMGGLDDFDMDGDLAWDMTDGNGIVVIVLDNGAQQDHPDINQMAGMDFTGQFGDGGPSNYCENHGTAVAGCISAIMNNQIGIAGIAPGCHVRSAKFNIAEHGPCTGGFDWFFADLVDALDWAQDVGDITNNSNSLPMASSITDKYAETRAAGIIHFAASGNSGGTNIAYPASLFTVNAVTSVNRFGALSDFSTVGVGLAYSAPGEAILTTDRTGDDGYSGGDYATVDGTSFASPYAAGVAALILSLNEGLSPAGVEAIMNATTTDLGAIGYDLTFGWGLVNARDAVVNTFCGQPFAGSCWIENATPGCNLVDCCATICDNDTFCCDGYWDQVCANAALAQCGGCDNDGGNCFSDNGSPGCNSVDCCSAVCAVDFFCCAVTWDGLCADFAFKLCDPANDTCVNATVIKSQGEFIGYLINANNDGSATCGESSLSPDAWYRYTAPCAGMFSVNTCGTNDGPGMDQGMDTVLSIHTACPGTGSNQIACNDDAPSACPGDLGLKRDSALSLSLAAGQTIYVRVAYFGAGAGDGSYLLNVNLVAPSNDHCNQAASINLAGATFCTQGANFSLPVGCGMYSSIWYSLVSPITGSLLISTCGSNFDTEFGVYESCGSQHSLACTDTNTCGLSSQVTVNVESGTTYKIRIGGFLGVQGTGIINFQVLPPPNDGCNNAAVIEGGVTPFSSAGAGTDGPTPCGNLGNDIWFDYTAPFTGMVTVSTCGSEYDTTIAAYGGNCACPVNPGNLLACSGNFCGPNNQQSQITFPVVEGDCYKIQVGGLFGTVGEGILTITEPDLCDADTNDDGVVNVSDLVNVILDWSCVDPPGPCLGDVNQNGVVDVTDLVAVILAWGAC